MESHISATDAARTFSDLLNRVRYRGETFVVERGGVPICRMGPTAPLEFTLAELSRLLSHIPSPGTAFLDDVEAHIGSQPLPPDSPWES